MGPISEKWGVGSVDAARASHRLRRTLFTEREKHAGYETLVKPLSRLQGAQRAIQPS